MGHAENPGTGGPRLFFVRADLGRLLFGLADIVETVQQAMLAERVDLESQTISRPDGEKIHFDIDPFRKHCLLNGLDDIGLTEQKGPDIAAYEQKARQSRPWVFGLTEKERA